MSKLRAKRIGTGYYEVPTPHGVYRVENMTAPKGSGGQSGWFVFRPSDTMADACRKTKREAMEYIEYLCSGDPDYKSYTPAPSTRVKIRLAYTIEVDYDGWLLAYGTAREDFRDDVKSYFRSQITQCPAAEEADIEIVKED